MDIITIDHWGEHNKIIKPLNLTNIQTLIYIDNIWLDNANYLDFIAMPAFHYTKWYQDFLAEENINVNTNWDWFKNEFIPNISNKIANYKTIK